MVLDEFRVIELASRLLPRPGGARSVLGFDDAVAVEHVPGRFLVFNVDCFDEASDLLPGMGLGDAGWTALVMALSDVFAKGAEPLGCLLGLSLPSSYGEDEVVELLRGLGEAASRYGVGFWGGDTGFSDSLHISMFAVGTAERVVPRSGARPGDLVVTTGVYGVTSAAFKYLLGRGLEPCRGLDSLLRRAYRPSPNLREWLHVTKYLSSSIDCSDGLALSLHLLAEESGVGIVLERVPLDPVAKECLRGWGFNPVSEALYSGGEEFELIGTVSPELWEDARREAAEAGLELRVIGRVVEGRGVFLEAASGRVEVKKRGWVHSSRT